MEINCDLCRKRIWQFYQIKARDNKELEICETCFIRLGGNTDPNFYEKTDKQQLAKEIFFAFEEVEWEGNNIKNFPYWKNPKIKTEAHKTNKTETELLEIYKKAKELEKSAKKEKSTIIKHFQKQKVWYWTIASETLKKMCSECNKEFSGSEDVLELCCLPNNVLKYLERQLDEKYRDKDNSWLLKNGFEALAGSIAKNGEHEEENKKLWGRFIQKAYHSECLQRISLKLFNKVKAGTNQEGWWVEGKKCYYLPKVVE